jgi:hypothetical protein
MPEFKNVDADFHPCNNKRWYASEIAVTIASCTSALVASPPIDRSRRPSPIVKHYALVSPRKDCLCSRGSSLQQPCQRLD